mmetsp:Transcript_83047/g.267627  ORF Transcript_83047/g.267627 Transcript_83047/m.267627 type:complete len:209 (-) Transcript_83047:76-702(-)
MCVLQALSATRRRHRLFEVVAWRQGASHLDGRRSWRLGTLHFVGGLGTWLCAARDIGGLASTRKTSYLSRRGSRDLGRVLGAGGPRWLPIGATRRRVGCRPRDRGPKHLGLCFQVAERGGRPTGRERLGARVRLGPVNGMPDVGDGRVPCGLTPRRTYMHSSSCVVRKLVGSVCWHVRSICGLSIECEFRGWMPCFEGDLLLRTARTA